MSDQRKEASKNPGQDNDEQHETARQMTEDALTEYVKGDQQKGNKLVEEAKRTDPSAVEEVLQDLDEDAEADHNVPDENR